MSEFRKVALAWLAYWEQYFPLGWMRRTASQQTGAGLTETWSRNFGTDIGEWPTRMHQALALVRLLPLAGPVRMADYGCGGQGLRTLIPCNWQYVPYDYIPRSPDTIVVDFNDAYPADTCDLIMCLGVLEYLDEPLELIRHLVEKSSYCCFSYCGPTSPERQHSQGWRNGLRFRDIEQEIERAGGKIIACELAENNSRIYLCSGASTPQG